MIINLYPEYDIESRKTKILRKMEDIYQMEIETFGTASFDIGDLENMELEELEDFAANY